MLDFSAVFRSLVLLTKRGRPFATTRQSGRKNVFSARTGPPAGPIPAKTPSRCPYRSRSWTGTSSGWVRQAYGASNGRKETERYKNCRKDLPSGFNCVSNDLPAFLLENPDPCRDCCSFPFLFPQRFGAKLYRRILQLGKQYCRTQPDRGNLDQINILQIGTRSRMVYRRPLGRRYPSFGRLQQHHQQRRCPIQEFLPGNQSLRPVSITCPSSLWSLGRSGSEDFF